MIWKIPRYNDPEIIKFARSLGGDWIGGVKIRPHPFAKEFDCHNNVRSYSTDKIIKGYYFLQFDDIYQAIQHSIIRTDSGDLLDITPFNDNRKFNLFLSNPKHHSRNKLYHSLAKYNYSEGEYIMYYVYALINPENKQPFYIGKGKGDRAESHLKNVANSRNKYKDSKIQKIREQGFEPEIIYIVENIENEDLAYELEEKTILYYGRKGYEENGILTNSCLGVNPPNHKGKTYEEIYGYNKAKQQREMRSRLQKERGGYGPKKHSKLTKQKIKETSMGMTNGNCSKLSEEDIINIGKDLNRIFDGVLSNKRWKWYCNKNNIPINILTTFRFGGKHIFDVFSTQLGLKIVSREAGLRWLNNGSNKIRMYDWEIEQDGIPDGYSIGRGKYKYMKYI